MHTTPPMHTKTTMTHATRRNPRRADALLIGAMLTAAIGLTGCKQPNNPEKMSRELAAMRAAETADARAALDLVREGQRLEKAEKPEKALEAYKQAALTYRETPSAWINIGRLSMQRGESLEAAEAFSTAGELAPKDPTPIHNLGALWESLGWPNDALRYYSDALARDQDYLPSLRRSVLLDVRLGKVTELTETRLRRALILEKDPKWRELLERAQVRLSDGSLENSPRPYQTTPPSMLEKKFRPPVPPAPAPVPTREEPAPAESLPNP